MRVTNHICKANNKTLFGENLVIEFNKEEILVR